MSRCCPWTKEERSGSAIINTTINNKKAKAKGKEEKEIKSKTFNEQRLS